VPLLGTNWRKCRELTRPPIGKPSNVSILYEFRERLVMRRGADHIGTIFRSTLNVEPGS
jgi:hypothetical protein